MAHQQLQRPPRHAPLGLTKREAADGAEMDGEQIGIVGLVAWIGRLPVLLGGERMNHAGLERSSGEGSLHRLMIASGTLDGHETVPVVVLGEDGAHLSDRRVKSGAVVLLDRGRGENVAVKVVDHELGTHLSTVDATMPKCSGPTFCTRGWKAPFGL